MEDEPDGRLAWLPDSGTYEWWPALSSAVAGEEPGPHGRDDRGPTGRTVPLLNAQRVPPGEHTDRVHPASVVAVLRWATGDELVATEALERWTTEDGSALVRVRVRDRRVLTAAVWLPAADVRPPAGASPHPD